MSAEPVVIVDHDARWFDAFDVAATELRDALRPWVVDIEHIGSTAVAALASRPSSPVIERCRAGILLYSTV